MKYRAAVVLLSTIFLPGLAQAADVAGSCNLLGREVALRAAEQINAALDAEQRTQLALIVEAACEEYQADALLIDQAGQSPGADAEGEDNKFLTLDLIAPEDRVRRTALKRR
jgi:hypothetical protein